MSVNPWSRRHSNSCSRTGFPSIFIIGFGISLATEEIRVPLPPAIITVFIVLYLSIPHAITFLLLITAGTPTAIAFSGTSSKTTAFAPIIELSPTLISPKITAPAPIITLFPIRGGNPGCLFSAHLHPSVTLPNMRQFSPIVHSSCTTHPTP